MISIDLMQRSDDWDPSCAVTRSGRSSGASYASTHPRSGQGAGTSPAGRIRQPRRRPPAAVLGLAVARDSSSNFAVCFKDLLADACRRLRKQKKELAYIAGERADYFSKLQSGERRPHDQHIVLRIATALRLDLPATERLLEAAGFPPLVAVNEQMTPEVSQALAIRPTDGAVAPLTGLLIGAARLTEEQISMRLARLGVTHLEAAVLTRLYSARGGTLTMPDLRNLLRVSRAMATFTVSQLQARGLVSRVDEGGSDPGIPRGLFSASPEQNDGHVGVSLTMTGRTLLEPITMVLEGVEALLRRSLTSRSSSDLRRTVDAFSRLR